MRKKFLILIAFICIVLSGCGNHDSKVEKITNEVMSNQKNVGSTVSYEESEYGLADDVIYGTYTSTTERKANDKNAITTKHKIEIKKDSNKGVLFLKNVNDDKSSTVCVRIDDVEDDDITLYCGFTSDSNTSTTWRYSCREMKSRYYYSLEGTKLVVIEIKEDKQGMYDGNYYLKFPDDLSDEGVRHTFEEHISVFDTSNEMKMVLEVSRTIDYNNASELKDCSLKTDDNNIAYASGYDGYENKSAKTVNTEQEFCDKVNGEFNNLNINVIKMERTSWKNRWYRLNVDESKIPNDMVKVDVEFEKGKASNGTVTGDIVISKNKKKDKDIKIADEEKETEVEYKTIAPKNQEYNKDIISGTWVSENKEYVYILKYGDSMAIQKSGLSSAEGSYRCIRTSGDIKVKNGTFVFSNTGKVILEENMGDEKGVEFSIKKDEMKSDKIKLKKLEDEYVTQLLGTWTKDNRKLEIKDDGTYKYKYSDSGWGYYFVLSPSEVIMSKAAGSFRKYDFAISDSMIILDEISYHRQTSGNSAQTLKKIKENIVGTWKETKMDWEYRFNEQGEWKKYSVVYAGDQVVSETLLEQGSYKVMNSELVKIEQQGGVMFHELTYNSTLESISGDGINLTKSK